MKRNDKKLSLPRIHQTTQQKRKARWGWFFILPWFIGTVYFFVIPMVQAAVYAFNDVTMAGGTTVFEYVGFKNFIDLFSGNANFLPDLTEALLTMLYEVPVILVFSLLIAMVLRGSYKGHTFFRATFFFPVIIASGVVITILRTQVMMADSATSAQQQAYMFNLPDFQVLTTLFGLPDFIVEFASDVVNGFFDITWKSGIQIILLLVAVNHISPSYYEVADIAGATAWEKLWKVTIPMIAPTILVVIIYTIIDSFTDYGNVIMRMIDDYAGNSQYSYSTAIALVYFLIVAALIGIVTLSMRRFSRGAEY